MNDQETVAGTSALLIAALQSHFKAKRDQAVAHLSIYVNNPVGVGDHQNILKECVDLVEQVAAAEENMRVVQKLFVRKD
jgi:hypothetical protein